MATMQELMHHYLHTIDPLIMKQRESNWILPQALVRRLRLVRLRPGRIRRPPGRAALALLISYERGALLVIEPCMALERYTGRMSEHVMVGGHFFLTKSIPVVIICIL